MTKFEMILSSIFAVIFSLAVIALTVWIIIEIYDQIQIIKERRRGK